MEFNNLKDILRQAGVTGAGGAGFPSYAKLNTNADTVILNCAECEPLLKLHRQLMELYTREILSALSMICKSVGAKEFVVGIKKSYTGALNALNSEISDFDNGRIHIIDEIYPSGDEVVLTYNITGRIVPAGGIPIDVGVIVYNVETVLNAYNAIKNSGNVTHKYVTIAGEVKRPQTLKVPIGTRFSYLIELCSGKTCDDPVIIQGGPMTGKIALEGDCVTKTTNAVLVIPKEHYIINRRNQKITVGVRRAMSACCQCKTCTELCPRNLLGHPISPSDFMKSLTSTRADTKALIDTQYCSQCGLCELYACPLELSPATLIGTYKTRLRENGVKVEKLPAPKSVREERKYRQVPMHRLVERLGIGIYDVPAPLSEKAINPKSVKIALSQSIGAPSIPVVKIGDKVKTGDMIAKPKTDALSVALHSSLDGKVTDVTERYIVISSK